MTDSRYPQAGRLRRHRAVIKLALIGLLPAFPTFGDARTPCPALEVTQSCAAEGVAVLTLRASDEAPTNLSYVISAQVPGQTARRLAPGANLSVSLPAKEGQQITLAVVGLDPNEAGQTACCLSNQRVHLQSSCVADRSDLSDGVVSPMPASVDLGVEVNLDDTCQRTHCTGNLTVTGSVAETVQVTLSAKEATQISGAECSGFVNGHALCDIMAGAALPIDLAFAGDVAQGPVTFCAQLGVADDDASRALALQTALARAGYDVGPVDGVFGAASLSALTRFTQENGLPLSDGEVSPEVLSLLGLASYSDANSANDLNCAEAQMPARPLACDARTTRISGTECACRYKGMRRVSDDACACPKGTALSSKGCVARVRQPDQSGPASTNPETATPVLRCDPLTTVLRNGACECRYEGSVKVREDVCLCATGLPPVPGQGCLVDRPGDTVIDQRGRP